MIHVQLHFVFTGAAMYTVLARLRYCTSQGGGPALVHFGVGLICGTNSRGTRCGRTLPRAHHGHADTGAGCVIFGTAAVKARVVHE